MPRRPPPRARKPLREAKPSPAGAPARPRRRWPIPLGVVAAILGLGVLLALTRPRPSALDEAHDALKRGQAARAERALQRASAEDPGDPEPWLLRLEILRMEDRQVEAQAIGWRAYQAVRGAARRQVLKAMTLALLADAPEDLAREMLARWSEADPSDVDARVGLLQRIAAGPHAGDPDRAARAEELSHLVAEHPDHPAAREALAMVLDESGRIDAGRAVLDEWPEAARDARYERLRGRWDLAYDGHPDRAVRSFRAALEVLPHDWRTRNRLVRALRDAGRAEEARRAADEVERLREVLEPLALGRRLDADLEALDDPKSRRDLADLCTRAGLLRLADAWRLDASESGNGGGVGGRP